MPFCNTLYQITRDIIRDIINPQKSFFVVVVVVENRLESEVGHSLNMVLGNQLKSEVEYALNMVLENLLESEVAGRWTWSLKTDWNQRLDGKVDMGYQSFLYVLSPYAYGIADFICSFPVIAALFLFIDTKTMNSCSRNYAEQ